MTLRILPALALCLFATTVQGQSVNPEQYVGAVEGREGDTMVVAAGASETVFRTYRIYNIGDGTVSVGAGENFVDLAAGNALDFMVSDSTLQVTFQDASELEYHLVAITQ